MYLAILGRAKGVDIGSNDNDVVIGWLRGVGRFCLESISASVRMKGLLCGVSGLSYIHCQDKSKRSKKVLRSGPK